MTEPDISVIIVNWNTCDLLYKCLTALVATQGVTSEIIIIDNGSTDQSVQMVREYFPDVHLISNTTNVGFAAANNQGLAAARARYCLLLNSDTVVSADALAQLVSFMDAHHQAGACGPQLRNADGSLQPSGRAFPNLFQAVLGLLPVPAFVRRAAAGPIEHRDYNRVAAVDEVSGAALCLRTTALGQVGLLDEDFFFLGEDVDLCWRLHKAGWEVYYVPQAVITHLWGRSRARLSEHLSLLAQRAYVLLLLKHRPGLPSAIIKVLAFALILGRVVRCSLPTLLRGNHSAAIACWRAYCAEFDWLRTL